MRKQHMVHCEPQSVKKVLEIPTWGPFRHKEGQISDVIRRSDQ